MDDSADIFEQIKKEERLKKMNDKQANTSEQYTSFPEDEYDELNEDTLHTEDHEKIQDWDDIDDQNEDFFKNDTIDVDELLFQNTSDFIVFVDKTGRFIKVNNAARYFSGFSEEELIGKRFWKLPGVFSKKNFPAFLTVFKNTLKGESTKDFVNELFDKNGNKHVISFSTYPIRKEGKICSVLVIGKDITSEKERENRFNSIVEHTSDFISVNRFSLKPVYMYVSPSFEKNLGYEPSELLGKNGFDYVHPEDRTKLFSLLKHYLPMKAKNAVGLNRKEFVEQISYRFKDKYGSWHDMESTVNSHGDELIFISKDVTEIKRTEKKLIESRNQHSEIFNKSRDGFVLVDAKGRIIDANDAYCEMLGYTLEELKELKDFYKITPEKYWDWEKKVIWDERLLKNGYSGQYEKEYIRKDGTVFPVELKSYVVCDDSGEIEYLWAVTRDITERKKAEESLKMRYDYEQVISKISSMFINPKDEDECIYRSLKLLGQLCKASRSYLFMLHEDMELMSNTHEWCNDDVDSQIHELQKLPTNKFPWWMDRLKQGKSIVISDLSEIPPEGKIEKEVLQGQDIKSVLVLPVSVDQKLIGFIGFDNTVDSYSWDDHDIKLLQLFSEIISTFLAKKNAEERMKRSEESYKVIFNSSTDSIFLHDLSSGKIIDVNQTALDKFGYTKQEILKLTPGDLSINEPPYTQKEANGWIQKAIEEGPQRFQWLSKKKNDELIWHENTLQKVRIAGKDRILVVGRDVTDQKNAENTLKENEKKYQTLFENMVQGVFIQRPDGSFADVNPAALNLLGVTYEEISNTTSFSSDWKTLDEDGSILPIEKIPSNLAFKTKKPVRNVTLGVFNQAKKDVVWMNVNAIPQFKENESDPYQVFVTIHDVTERRRIEQERENHLKEMKLITDMIVQASRMDDVDELCHYLGETIHSFNKNSYVSVSLYDPEINAIRIRSVSGLESVDPELQDLFTINPLNHSIPPRHIRFSSDQYLSGKLHRVSEGVYGTVANIISKEDCRLVEKKMNIKETYRVGFSLNDKPYGSISIFLKKGSDEIRYASAIETIANHFSEILHRKQTEYSLQKSEKKYRRLIETLNEGIWQIDEHTKTTFVNKHMADMLGYSQEEMMGKSLFSFMDEQGKKIAQEKLKRRSQGHSEQHNFEFLRKDGQRIYVDMITTPILDGSGKYHGALAAVIDITDLKKAHEELTLMNKELEQKVEERTEDIKHLLKQKDEFINQLGHDLKNPLGPFIHLLPILKKHMTTEKDAEIVEVLQRNAKYMLNLVKRTIELAKLNSSKTEFNFEFVDLSDLIDEVLYANSSLFDESNMIVENLISSRIPTRVDTLHIQEVFTNLFNNAVKYTNGPGKISIDAKKSDESILVSVKDTGIGINSDQLTYLFDEYFKADPSRHDFDSSGLGLPICKRIIERHGGRIWAESPGIGEGSTFYFTLPVSKKSE
jgi:PAS domain S-box-containing protein